MKGIKRTIKRDEILFILAVFLLFVVALSNVIWQNPVDPALAILLGGLLGLPLVSSSERKDQDI